MPRTRKLKLALLSIFFFFAISILAWTSNAQPLPPPKYDGFVYTKHPVGPDTIIIEAFLDPTCSDSRDTWEPLKQAVQHYGADVHLVIHLFPLPYHDNAYFASRALHIVNAKNYYATFQLLDSFFKHQEEFYNAKTSQLSRDSVIKLIVNFAFKELGPSYMSALKEGFSDPKTDLKTRVSFKYGCNKGVYGTPFFFVNGFALPDEGSPIAYGGWIKIIDPLIKASS